MLRRTIVLPALTLTLLVLARLLAGGLTDRSAAASDSSAPRVEVDPFWPKPLPNNWLMGQAAGVATDRHDHVWVIQRPKSLTEDERGATLNPPRSRCCAPAPPVLEFDADGALLQSWGGPGSGYTWPENEHGIFVDGKDNVWVAGNGPKDGQILKFTRDGKFLMKIGEPGVVGDDADTRHLNRPANMVLDATTNELYVADGYGNHRVIVFDAATGAYKRHWGAYGKPPTDDKISYDPKAALPPQFNNPVHCIRMSKDGLVYVCDRGNNRIQVFRKDGTYVTEFAVLKDTIPAATTGSIMLWPDAQQTYMLVSDDPNGEFHLLNRADGKYLASFGRVGHNAGEFDNLHNLAIDSKGNIYAAEVQGKRVQKFRNLGGL